jgi:hypothetical protein
MNILDTILSETICSNLVIADNGSRYCKFLTNNIGRLHPTSKSFCNLKCRNTGPYNNRDISSEEEKTFIISTLKKYNPFFNIQKEFIDRVLKTYRLPVDIVSPEEYYDVKKCLEFLNQYDGFKKILLTGSIITKNATTPLHDIDIVLWFSNLEVYINNNIVSKLPKEINGIKTDYFIIIGDKDISLSSLFFCCVSPEDKILYKSKWFELDLRSIPDGFTIIDAECEYFDIVMKEMFLNDNKKNKKCCGGKS